MDKRKGYLILIAAAVIILAAVILRPAYITAIDKDHLETCEKARHIIYWRFGTVMQEHLDNGSSTQANPDYEDVLYETVLDTLGEQAADSLEKVECDRSDMAAEFELPGLCRAGGTIRIYVKDLYHLELRCTQKGHLEPISD